MLSLNEIKSGIIIEYNDKPYQVLWRQHSKSGRSSAVLRTKLYDIVSGSKIEHTFQGNEKVEKLELERQKYQYLYCENDNCYFMHPSDFNQITIPKHQLAGKEKFLTEELQIEVVFYNDQPIDINLPIKMKFKVAYTEPGFKGNSQSTVTKPAKIETGAEIKVPLFINTDDEIIVDTRSGEYVARA